MRQAGRYLEEYRALRAQAGDFLTLCDTPAWAAEVTLQPLRRFDMDAAIIFSDILIVPRALGQDVRFAAGEGPRLFPVRTAADLRRLSLNGFEERLSPLAEAIALTRASLPREKALIGFVGAPWTVACYMIDGQGGSFGETRRLLREDRDLFTSLLDLVVTASIESLCLQVSAGADVVQIFDSWAGLAAEENAWQDMVVTPTARITEAFRARCPGTPVIGFPRGGSLDALRSYAAATGVDALGLGQEADFSGAVRLLGESLCLQGNLDPLILLEGGSRLVEETQAILDAARNVPFVFNLGHGVFKETPPEHVKILAETVRSFRR